MYLKIQGSDRMKKIQIIAILSIILMSGSICLTQIPQTLADEGSIATYELSFAQTTFNVAMPNNLTITAKDDTNSAINYTGTVTLTCSDPNAILPSSTTLSINNGTGSCILYFGTAGSQTITVTDTSNSTITGNITVTVNQIHFDIDVTPTSIKADESVNVTVTARDSSNNILTDLGSEGHGDAIEFNSTDSQATFPAAASSNLINGTGTFNITLSTSGNHTITAVNKDFPLVNATTSTITVNAQPEASPTPTPTSTPTATPTQTASPTPTEVTNDFDQNLIIIAVVAVVVVIVVVLVVVLLKRRGDQIEVS
jgi:hypothetical protein